MVSLMIDFPDEALRREGLSERAVRIEFAYRLFDAGRLTKPEASLSCGLLRDEFDAELIARGLPLVRYSEKMLEQDLKALQ